MKCPGSVYPLMFGEFYEGTFLNFVSLGCVFYIIIAIVIAYIVKYSAIIFVRVYCGNPWNKILSFLFRVPFKLQIDRFRRS